MPLDHRGVALRTRFRRMRMRGRFRPQAYGSRIVPMGDKPQERGDRRVAQLPVQARRHPKQLPRLTGLEADLQDSLFSAVRNRSHLFIENIDRGDAERRNKMLAVLDVLLALAAEDHVT